MCHLVELKDANKLIKGKSVLRNVSIGINNGECICITGRNGSGKTMLLRA